MNVTFVEIIESLREFFTNKAVSVVAASVSLGAASVEGLNHASASKGIDITTYYLGPFTISAWIALVTCFWVATLIIEKYGFFKLVKWLWSKATAEGSVESLRRGLIRWNVAPLTVAAVIIGFSWWILGALLDPNRVFSEWLVAALAGTLTILLGYVLKIYESLQRDRGNVKGELEKDSD